MTPLKGVDGEVYALAQGDLVVGGFGAEGQGRFERQGQRRERGRIANGAIVERGVETSFTEGSELRFNLIRPDFTTRSMSPSGSTGCWARMWPNALDAGTVQVRGPQDADQRVVLRLAAGKSRGGSRRGNRRAW